MGSFRMADHMDDATFAPALSTPAPMCTRVDHEDR